MAGLVTAVVAIAVVFIVIAFILFDMGKGDE